MTEFAGDFLENEPLSRHTYYRIGGPARYFAVPRGVDDLAWLADWIASRRLPYFILGLGSNLLVSDQGFEGLVIKTSRVDLDIDSPWAGTVHTGASVSISTLLRQASLQGWGGLQMLTGVPGSVGGAVAMNAGTHLGEVKDRVLEVHAYSLTRRHLEVFSGAKLRFEYRGNLFLEPDHVVTRVSWQVEPTDPVAVKAELDATLARRKATQPLDKPSCGSVFKNPRGAGLHAWQVIEKLGLRGHRIGNAQISEKHCNFIVNLGGATAAEVGALIDLAKSRALKELGIELEEEVRRL